VIGTLHIFWQNLEKYRQNSKSISQIKTLEGNIVSETNDILDTVHDYYEQLFSCVQTEDESIRDILQFIHASVDENNVEM
jgi:thiamine kinase-like enzyme